MFQTAGDLELFSIAGVGERFLPGGLFGRLHWKRPSVHFRNLLQNTSMHQHQVKIKFFNLKVKCSRTCCVNRRQTWGGGGLPMSLTDSCNKVFAPFSWAPWHCWQTKNITHTKISSAALNISGCLGGGRGQRFVGSPEGTWSVRCLSEDNGQSNVSRGKHWLRVLRRRLLRRKSGFIWVSDLLVRDKTLCLVFPQLTTSHFSACWLTSWTWRLTMLRGGSSISSATPD